MTTSPFALVNFDRWLLPSCCKKTLDPRFCSIVLCFKSVLELRRSRLNSLEMDLFRARCSAEVTDGSFRLLSIRPRVSFESLDRLPVRRNSQNFAPSSRRIFTTWSSSSVSVVWRPSLSRRFLAPPACLPVVNKTRIAGLPGTGGRGNIVFFIRRIIP